MDGDKPPKSRKSLLACARNSGVSLNSCDVESFLQDFPRLSINTGIGPGRQENRPSGQGFRTAVETPVNRGLLSSAKVAPSHIPRRLMAGASTSKLSSSKLPPVPGSTGGNASRGRLPVKSKGTGSGAKPSLTGGMLLMRRSISMESFSQNNSHVNNTVLSSMFTPRGRSNSPGPGSASATSTAKDVSKTIKLPGSQDKKILHNISHYIVESLKSMQYPKEFTHASFTQLSTKDFHSICGFLLAFFVGPKIEKVDYLTYIIDSLKMLGFPGVVNKSHLKTPNTPHALPTIYTLLSWLCNMAEVFMSSEDERCFQERLNEECLWESYMRLFYQYHISEKDLNVEAELENYRATVSEYRHPNPIPKERLLEEIQIKETEKINLFSLKDPREDIMAIISSQQEMLAKTKKRIMDLGELKQKYSNINALETEGRTLNSELKRNMASLHSLVKQIDAQPISPADAEKLKADTDKARKEKEMLEKLIDDLQLKVKRQQQFLGNNETRFYELCRQFSILESYNSSCKSWDTIFPVISQNPLDPKALKLWLDDTVKKLTTGQKRLKEYETVYTENCRRLQKEIEVLTLQYDAYNEEYQALSKDLGTKLNQETENLKILDEKIREAEHELAAIKLKFIKGENEYEASQKKYEKTIAEIARCEPYLKDLQEYSNELDAHIEEKCCVLRLAALDLESTLMAIVIDARNRINAPLWELDDPNYGM